MDDAESELEAEAKRRIGTTLRGKYRLERVIGVGGMAVVYKATHRNQAEFAVKMLHPELSRNEPIRTRFVREGYAANSVKHPGVVLVVDDDIAEDNAAFLVMELLDGAGCESLWEARGHRMSLEETSTIVFHLLDVLVAAHEKGIVHRDLKPANLFITVEGRVKVLDFGIARVRDVAASAAATATGMLLGTPAFMGPEQALAKASAIDARTDLWAVGATFFTLASGAFVHPGENGQQLMIMAATQPARSLATVLPGAPPPFVALVDRALAFDPQNRWASAKEMRNALANAHQSVFGGSPDMATLARAVANVRSGAVSSASSAVSSEAIAPTMPQQPISTPQQPISASTLVMPPPSPSSVRAVDVPSPAAPARRSGGVIAIAIAGPIVLAAAGALGLAAWKSSARDTAAASASANVEPAPLASTATTVSSASNAPPETATTTAMPPASVASADAPAVISSAKKPGTNAKVAPPPPTKPTASTTAPATATASATAAAAVSVAPKPYDPSQGERR